MLTQSYIEAWLVEGETPPPAYLPWLLASGWPRVFGLTHLDPKELIRDNFWPWSIPNINSLDSGFLEAAMGGHLGIGNPRKLCWQCGHTGEDHIGVRSITKVEDFGNIGKCLKQEQGRLLVGNGLDWYLDMITQMSKGNSKPNKQHDNVMIWFPIRRV